MLTPTPPMTTFEDGPAAGQTLMLKRAPYFLRVANNGGEWDALDMLNDSPRPRETLYAYERVRAAGMIHIKAGRGKGGFFSMGTYRFAPRQPADPDMRGMVAWRAWCRANVPAKASP